MSGWSLTSGCFDMLHVGHMRFLDQAARYGDLFVAVASDATIRSLKGRRPDVPQDERLESIRSLRSVARTAISPGSGLLDFAPLLAEFRPQRLIVNYDGDYPEKRLLCERLGIEYVVIQQRTGPHTTLLREACRIPFRIDLAGGWLDQPFVSRLNPGAVIVASLEPLEEYNVRSGLATSTRRTAQQLWGTRLPCEDPITLARLLFGSENPPGKEEVAGSQDALGICLPGVQRLHYDGEYWPATIEPCVELETLDWLSARLRLVEFPARPASTSILEGSNVTLRGAIALSQSADQCWQAIQDRDELRLGKSITACYRAQIEMFPKMKVRELESVLEEDCVIGAKLCGAGGGGYALTVCPADCQLGLPVRIRASCL
ncbi:adenylyltransferase/cytidyltransferase family protein [Blastopirellula marina]|uniref:Cytidyltransferase n=1 Tax=Blastopirellula marina TaxID=124 RepID=A0A2S8GIG8_9BACT|nr:adenylyltransferase/cytidyltransferase family protein [Blastopirellula marina]PQO43824.1 cytidyltransferase [Blastopirellula marina]